MPAPIIPDLSDPRVLRNVTLRHHPGYRLLTWEPVGAPRFSSGQFKIGYAFYVPDLGSVRGGRAVEPMFSGEDFGCSPMDPIDSDRALAGLLGFLTLRPGDTDSEYFADYTPEQLDWCESCAEELSMYGFDDEDFAPVSDRFVNVDESEEP